MGEDRSAVVETVARLLAGELASPEEAVAKIREAMALDTAQKVEEEEHDTLGRLLGAIATEHQDDDAYWLKLRKSERRHVPAEPDIQLFSDIPYNKEVMVGIRGPDMLGRLYDLSLMIVAYAPIGASDGVYGVQEYEVADLVIRPSQEAVDSKPLARLYADSALWLVQQLFLKGFVPPLFKDILAALTGENRALRETILVLRDRIKELEQR